MAAHSTLNIPKLYPIIAYCKELPGIALPPPLPLDLPTINLNRKIIITSHQQVVREQPIRTGDNLGTVSEAICGWKTMTSVNDQQALHSQNMDFSHPVSVISRVAEFLTAGDDGMMLKVLEILDKLLVLPEDIDMAKEFGQGLAYYKNLHYRAAKPCFNALFEKSVNYHSSGNQALASIYLGEIEMSWAKYKDAEKYFTLAVTYYSPDNVAEKSQQTILAKSVVLEKKEQCHKFLSQIREAINAFKMAKEVAELAQEQARGSACDVTVVYYFSRSSYCQPSVIYWSNLINELTNFNTEDRISVLPQPDNEFSLHHKDQCYLDTTHKSCSHVFEEGDSEISVNDLLDSVNNTGNKRYVVFRCIHGNSSVVNGFEFSYNNNGQESFQTFLQSPSLSVNVFGHKRYLPFHTEYVLLRGDGSSSSSDDDDSNNGEDKRGILL